MFSSIRAQLISVLVALIALILIQGYVARENQDILNTGVASASKAVIEVGLVKELERDVIDLQRNVLIFKENASKSAITRFSRLMVSINEKLNTLAGDGSSVSISNDDYILTRMREHLSSYQENFTQVVDARSERDNLVTAGSLSDITQLEALLRESTENGLVQQKDANEALAYLLKAENTMLKYFAKPDVVLIRSFNAAIDAFLDMSLSNDLATQRSHEALAYTNHSREFVLS